MKKILTVLIMGITIFVFGYVYATDTFELKFKTINNKEKEPFDLYLLLPKKYIEFAIDKADVKLDYDRANTLKKNTILGIMVKEEMYKMRYM